MKRYSTALIPTRIETWAMPGVPDLMVCDAEGRFHLIELKATTNHAVELRPHQVSFLTKHQHSSCWILVKRQRVMTDPAQVYLYPARQAVDLRMEGLDKINPAALEEEPVNWANIFRLIFGPGSDKSA